jgi:peptidoglycan/LPS O-acetylase OafA/YrhL
MPSHRPPTRRRAKAICALAAVTALVCAGLLTAAALVPAPAAALPLLVIVCIGCPMMAACELPGALARLRAPRALETLRRQLDSLPETQHPLGL